MYIKSDEDFCDEYGESLYPDICLFDWKRWGPDNAEEIAEALELQGIDVIEYETGGDFYAIRFVQKGELK